MNLKPCPFRQVGDEGHILCNKIKSGDKEVSPNICRECPISAINCAHLRATLDHSTRLPITVRYGNGKTEVWDDVGGPAIKLERAACAAKVVPIHTPHDCAGCALRSALVTPESMMHGAVQRAPISALPSVADRRKPRNVPAQPVMTPPAAMTHVPAPVAHQNTQPAPSAEKRDSIVAQKIIQLQEWLTKQKHVPAPESEKDDAPGPIVMRENRAASPGLRGEEKRVGWTD